MISSGSGERAFARVRRGSGGLALWQRFSRTECVREVHWYGASSHSNVGFAVLVVLSGEGRAWDVAWCHGATLFFCRFRGVDTALVVGYEMVWYDAFAALDFGFLHLNWTMVAVKFVVES